MSDLPVTNAAATTPAADPTGAPPPAPVDAQQWHEIVQLHLRLAMALDTNDWPLYRACLAPMVTAHYEGAGLPEVSVPADDWTRFVAAAVTPQTTVHYFTNFTPRSTGPDAGVGCRFSHQSCHRVDTGGAGDPTLVQYGTYETEVTRTDGSWVIRRIHHRVAWAVGNPALVDPEQPALVEASSRVFGSG